MKTWATEGSSTPPRGFVVLVTREVRGVLAIAGFGFIYFEVRRCGVVRRSGVGGVFRYIDVRQRSA